MANFTQTLTTEQKFHVKLNPVDAIGKSQPLASPATFTADAAFDGTVTPDADNLGATVVAGATAGTFTLTITAEGDSTPGVDTLTDTVTITVTNPEDIALGTVIEAPTAQ